MPQQAKSMCKYAVVGGEQSSTGGGGEGPLNQGSHSVRWDHAGPSVDCAKDFL